MTLATGTLHEHDHAVLLVRWMTRRRIVFLHVANEGPRSKQASAKLKAEGLMPGFPDYLILTATAHAPRGVAIELKASETAARRENKKKREQQRVWIERLNGLGIPAARIIGYERSIEFLETWGY